MTASAQDTVIKTFSGHSDTGTLVSGDGQELMVKTSEAMEWASPTATSRPRRSPRSSWAGVSRRPRSST